MFFEIFDDPAEAVPRKEAVIYCSDNLRFFRDNFGTAVYTSAVSEEMFVMEGDVSLFCTPSLAPLYIGTDIFGFALCHASIDGDVKFR